MKNAKEIASAYLLIEAGKAAQNGAIENTWGDAVLFIQSSINGMEGEKAADAAATFLAGTVESEIRAQGATRMPGAYRSAKSVLTKALRMGVALLDASGKPRGKTAVEKDCKEPKTPEEQLAALLTRAVKLAGEDGVPFTPEAIASLKMLATLASK